MNKKSKKIIRNVLIGMSIIVTGLLFCPPWHSEGYPRGHYFYGQTQYSRSGRVVLPGKVNTPLLMTEIGVVLIVAASVIGYQLLKED